jgi:hypothetical protein
MSFVITQNLTNGATANFVDTTAYGTGSNPNYSDIKCVRFLWGNYIVQQGQQVYANNEVLEQWREYQSLTLAGYVYDNKTIPHYGTFIPFISGITVLSGSEMQETGQYSLFVPPSTYLPTANYTPYLMTPTNVGVEEIENRFPDGVYWVTYETYVDNSPLTPTNVVDGKQYMVFGNGATATYNGNTYRQGEVFIASNSGVISFTGGGTVKVLSSIEFQYFSFVYSCLKRLADLQVYLQANCICNESLQYQINSMYNKLRGVEFASIQNLVAAGIVQGVIDDVSIQLNVVYSGLGL